ncbi:hypothetical protein PR048_024088 [Dryococelus australis]|uniref:Uncharacterized protein n=1 Tax=Dryococelus australis TaxID=614101 RepID=A0ABQ9GVY9_9NEOP|nr:hypothetical protein PR048_024088 [Dryococelus australis]
MVTTLGSTEPEEEFQPLCNKQLKHNVVLLSGEVCGRAAVGWEVVQRAVSRHGICPASLLQGRSPGFPESSASATHCCRLSQQEAPLAFALDFVRPGLLNAGSGQLSIIHQPTKPRARGGSCRVNPPPVFLLSVQLRDGRARNATLEILNNCTKFDADIVGWSYVGWGAARVGNSDDRWYQSTHRSSELPPTHLPTTPAKTTRNIFRHGGGEGKDGGVQLLEFVTVADLSAVARTVPEHLVRLLQVPCSPTDAIYNYHFLGGCSLSKVQLLEFVTVADLSAVARTSGCSLSKVQLLEFVTVADLSAVARTVPEHLVRLLQVPCSPTDAIYNYHFLGGCSLSKVQLLEFVTVADLSAVARTIPCSPTDAIYNYHFLGGCSLSKVQLLEFVTVADLSAVARTVPEHLVRLLQVPCSPTDAIYNYHFLGGCSLSKVQLLEFVTVADLSAVARTVPEHLVRLLQVPCSPTDAIYNYHFLGGCSLSKVQLLEFVTVADLSAVARTSAVTSCPFIASSPAPSPLFCVHVLRKFLQSVEMAPLERMSNTSRLRLVRILLSEAGFTITRQTDKTAPTPTRIFLQRIKSADTLTKLDYMSNTVWRRTCRIPCSYDLRCGPGMEWSDETVKASRWIRNCERGKSYRLLTFDVCHCRLTDWPAPSKVVNDGEKVFSFLNVEFNVVEVTGRRGTAYRKQPISDLSDGIISDSIAIASCIRDEFVVTPISNDKGDFVVWAFDTAAESLSRRSSSSSHGASVQLRNNHSARLAMLTVSRRNLMFLTNRIRLERASQKQSSDTHKTPYIRVKRRRERTINIKASERVNVDVFTQNKRPCPQHSHAPFFKGVPAQMALATVDKTRQSDVLRPVVESINILNLRFRLGLELLKSKIAVNFTRECGNLALPVSAPHSLSGNFPRCSHSRVSLHFNLLYFSSVVANVVCALGVHEASWSRDKDAAAMIVHSQCSEKYVHDYYLHIVVPKISLNPLENNLRRKSGSVHRSLKTLACLELFPTFEAKKCASDKGDFATLARSFLVALRVWAYQRCRYHFIVKLFRKNIGNVFDVTSRVHSLTWKNMGMMRRDDTTHQTQEFLSMQWSTPAPRSMAATFTPTLGPLVKVGNVFDVTSRVHSVTWKNMGMMRRDDTTHQTQEFLRMQWSTPAPRSMAATFTPTLGPLVKVGNVFDVTSRVHSVTWKNMGMMRRDDTTHQTQEFLRMQWSTPAPRSMAATFTPTLGWKCVRCNEPSSQSHMEEHGDDTTHQTQEFLSMQWSTPAPRSMAATFTPTLGPLVKVGNVFDATSRVHSVTWKNMGMMRRDDTTHQTQEFLSMQWSTPAPRSMAATFTPTLGWKCVRCNEPSSQSHMEEHGDDTTHQTQEFLRMQWSTPARRSMAATFTPTLGPLVKVGNVFDVTSRVHSVTWKNMGMMRRDDTTHQTQEFLRMQWSTPAPRSMAATFTPTLGTLLSHWTVFPHSLALLHMCPTGPLVKVGNVFDVTCRVHSLTWKNMGMMRRDDTTHQTQEFLRMQWSTPAPRSMAATFTPTLGTLLSHWTVFPHSLAP